jgi:hypothetical protein
VRPGGASSSARHAGAAAVGAINASYSPRATVKSARQVASASCASTYAAADIVPGRRPYGQHGMKSAESAEVKGTDTETASQFAPARLGDEDIVFH